MDFSIVLANLRVQNNISIRLRKCLEQCLEMTFNDCERKLIHENFPFNVKGLSLIRFFTSNRKTAFVIAGTTDNNTIDFFSKLDPKKAEECESLMIQTIHDAIIEEVHAHNQNFDIKSTLMSTEENLSFLKNVSTKNSLRFIFKSESLTIAIDIPIGLTGNQAALILENTGFSEQSKILIVDDSRLNRLVLSNYLQTVGFVHLEEAKDGAEAMQKIVQSVSGYSLIIADWHMPTMSGIELLKNVRLNPQTRSIPFILATSEQKKEEVLEALKYKVSGYIVKPYSSDMLLKSMKTAALKK